MRHRTVIIFLVTLWPPLSPTAGAQSFNIDLGRGHGYPPSNFAAAGLAGVWNSPVPDLESRTWNCDRGMTNRESGETEASGPPTEELRPSTLRDLQGRFTDATFERGPVDYLRAYHCNDPATMGNAETLLDDYAYGGTDAAETWIFDNLENGMYEVLVYAWKPTRPEDRTTVRMKSGGSPESYNLVGGVWLGAFVEGTTHALRTVHVTDGRIFITTSGSILGWSGAFNGVQLVYLGSIENEHSLEAPATPIQRETIGGSETTADNRLSHQGPAAK